MYRVINVEWWCFSYQKSLQRRRGSWHRNELLFGYRTLTISGDECQNYGVLWSDIVHFGRRKQNFSINCLLHLRKIINIYQFRNFYLQSLKHTWSVWVCVWVSVCMSVWVCAWVCVWKYMCECVWRRGEFKAASALSVAQNLISTQIIPHAL